jgi:putative phosphoribosyl transferase
MRFEDRTHAGRLLADALLDHASDDVVVLALPRGGVVVGVEVARALSAPLDLVIPRKVGHPDFPEYGIAAVAEAGEVVANEAETARVDRGWFERAVAAQRAEAQRRRAAYLGGRPAMDLAGRTAIVVDDGIATGLTMRAAVRDVRHRGAARVVVAVPVAPADAVAALRASVDEVITLIAPEAYEGAVGAYYRTFGQVGDDEVVRCLAGDDMTWAAP